MIEKIKTNRLKDWGYSGYWKPQGKECKRYIHKMVRRMKNIDTNRKGIYNRIGVHWEWS